MGAMEGPTIGIRPGAENRRQYFFTANIAISALAVLFVSLRLLSKGVVLRTFGWDDGMMIMGLACSVTSTVILCLQTQYGLGYHQADLLDPTILTGFFKIMYAAVLLYIFTCLFVKVSIVLFYRRLGHNKTYIRCVWALIIFNLLVCTTMSLPAAFSCTPVKSFWDHSVSGKCIDQQKLYTVNTALNVTTDFATLILPIPIVWKAQMALKKRLIVIAMFGLGGFVCIASLIRVTKLFGPASAQDITWAAVDSHTWSMIEVNSGIIAGCVPTLKPLFRKCFNFLRDTTQGSKASRPTYESNELKGVSNNSGTSKKLNPWRQYNKTAVIGGDINGRRPSTLARMYHGVGPTVTNSDEELIMEGAGDDKEIWRTMEVKVETESTHGTVQPQRPPVKDDSMV